MLQARKYLAGLVVLGLCACAPVSSKYPLGEKKSDPALVGSWIGDGFHMVIKRKGRARYSIVVRSTAGEEDGPESLDYLVQTSQISSKGYMSIKTVWSAEVIEDFARYEDVSVSVARNMLSQRDKRLDGWYLAHYRIVAEDGVDVLSIYLMDKENNIVEAALESGELDGSEITVADAGEDETEIVYLTSSTRKLTDFVEGHADNTDDLFDFGIGRMKRQ